MSEYVCTACRLGFHERCNDRACKCTSYDGEYHTPDGCELPSAPVRDGSCTGEGSS